jgi:hypothetical protein
VTSHDHALAISLYGECPRCLAGVPGRHPAGDGRPVPDFDGGTYRRPFDHTRLAGQLRRVYDVMADGRWRTLAELAELAKAPEASVSARLRDLRKPEFGAFHVEHRREGDPSDGLWAYRLVVDAPSSPGLQ